MYPENMTLFLVDLYPHFVKYLYSYRYMDLFIPLLNELFMIYTAPYVPIFFYLIERYPTQTFQIQRLGSE